MTVPFTMTAVKGIAGEVHVAPDKSISHRGLILAALANGTSRIRNLLLGSDVLCSLRILRQLGIHSSHRPEDLKAGVTLEITGRGLKGFKAPAGVLDCGNSGTGMRLFLGLLGAQPFESVLTGDASLNKRPMGRVMEPLGLMGARFKVEERDGGRFIHVLPALNPLKAIHYASPVASAQVKSALLLAGLYADGKTTIFEPSPSRDHTEIMLAAMHGKIQTTLSSAASANSVTVSPHPKLKPLDIVVPGDISSAAFFMVAALITPGSDIHLKGIGLNPTRTGILDVLIAMGGDITIEGQSSQGGEMVGDVRFKSSPLRNLNVGGDLIPRLIDEIPILALAASQAQGRMVVSDARELRVKETDRIRAIACELAKMGVHITEREDGFSIEGGARLKSPRKPFKSYGDHRMAMMAAVAGLILPKSAVIDDVACVNTSFPDFFKILKSVSR